MNANRQDWVWPGCRWPRGLWEMVQEVLPSRLQCWINHEGHWLPLCAPSLQSNIGRPEGFVQIVWRLSEYCSNEIDIISGTSQILELARGRNLETWTVQCCATISKTKGFCWRAASVWTEPTGMGASPSTKRGRARCKTPTNGTTFQQQQVKGFPLWHECTLQCKRYG